LIRFNRRFVLFFMGVLIVLLIGCVLIFIFKGELSHFLEQSLRNEFA